MSNKKEGLDKLSYVQLGQLADITMGQSPDSSGYNSNKIGLPFLQGCAEFGRLSPTAKVYCNPPLRVSKTDSILISVRAPVGTQNWGHERYCIGRGLSAIKAKPGIADTKFLSYALANNVAFLHRRSQGSTFLAIGANDLRNFPIPHLDFPLQSKISAILQTTDDIIEKSILLIEKYQKIKISMMCDFFTRGICADRKLRPSYEHAAHLYQGSEIGFIPKGWSIHRLEKLLAPVVNNFRSGPFGSALLKAELVEEGIPFLGIDNIHIENFDATFKRFVSEKKFNELIRYAVRPRDVVITIMGTVGRAAVIPHDIGLALSSKHLWTMTFDQTLVIPELVCWQLNFAPWVKSWFRKETQGGIMDAIQSKTLKSLVLPLPPIEEQNLIYEKYLVITKKIQAEEKFLKKIIKEKEGLMNNLLTGKISVQLKYKEAEAIHV